VIQSLVQSEYKRQRLRRPRESFSDPEPRRSSDVARADSAVATISSVSSIHVVLKPINVISIRDQPPFYWKLLNVRLVRQREPTKSLHSYQLRLTRGRILRRFGPKPFGLSLPVPFRLYSTGPRPSATGQMAWDCNHLYPVEGTLDTMDVHTKDAAQRLRRTTSLFAYKIPSK